MRYYDIGSKWYNTAISPIRTKFVYRDTKTNIMYASMADIGGYPPRVNKMIVEKTIGTVGDYNITQEVLKRLVFVGKQCEGIQVSLHYFFKLLAEEKELVEVAKHYTGG